MMIELTEEQVNKLIEHKYKNYYYYENYPETKMNTNPWYKSFPIDENTNFEIVINPVCYKNQGHIVIGVNSERDISEEEKLINTFCTDDFYDAKEILEEMLFLQSIGVLE